PQHGRQSVLAGAIAWLYQKIDRRRSANIALLNRRRAAHNVGAYVVSLDALRPRTRSLDAYSGAGRIRDERRIFLSAQTQRTSRRARCQTPDARHADQRP